MADEVFEELPKNFPQPPGFAVWAVGCAGLRSSFVSGVCLAFTSSSSFGRFERGEADLGVSSAFLLREPRLKVTGGGFGAGGGSRGGCGSKLVGFSRVALSVEPLRDDIESDRFKASSPGFGSETLADLAQPLTTLSRYTSLSLNFPKTFAICFLSFEEA